MSEIGQQLIEIVRQKAAENPDFVYKFPRTPAGMFISCQYVQDGGPGCIIGQALWEAGLVDAQFEECATNTSPAYEVVERLGLELDGQELDWLCRVQARQDRQSPWGKAVENTDAVVRV